MLQGFLQNVSLEYVILNSLVFCYFFFIFHSPIFEWFWKNLTAFKVTQTGNHLWLCNKLEYLLKCAFCSHGWIMIAATVVNQNLLIYCLTSPFVSLIVWQVHIFLKKPKQIVKKQTSK